MVFDGCGKAAVGLCHDRRYFGTEVDHEHLAFLNFTDAAVFVDPKAPYAMAETVFANCLFENCRRGVSISRPFNDYDYTFDGCEFRHCETASCACMATPTYATAIRGQPPGRPGNQRQARLLGPPLHFGRSTRRSWCAPTRWPR